MQKLEKLTALEKLLRVPTPKPAEIGLLKEGILVNGRSLTIDKVNLNLIPRSRRPHVDSEKKTKQLKGEASTSSTSKADFELDVPTSSESEEEVMAENPERTINEMTSPDLNQQPLCIEYPTLDVDFELKSGLIHLLPTFRGLAGEDPHKHIKEFHVVCSGMRPQGVTEEHVKLRAFPFSLGLFEANRSLVDAVSGGALYDKTPTEARKLITTMAANNQQFGSRSDNPPRKEGLNKSKLVGFAHLRDISPMLAPLSKKNLPCMPMP
ncbi:hypothetical protein Sango_1564400 [Sesamum angolense]|uniref:Reverse transcriptase domain-containing protein n=1 Tax=Sesamum angolense TaxID=2727404 RepID=A0AAE2BTR3_9LAMI|nr:hypothetical protein Sango_1564400 [Sesamum angolense]